MTNRHSVAAICLRGVRHNNLKNFDLDLPLGRLTVITGLSGSGKSSLAFDTLFAEGQRRYVETFSPYARQFFDRMDKPQVDRIEGIPPAIAIEQRNTVRSTRSTVGTMTEVCEFMKLLWPHLAQLHCKQCGQPVRKEPPQLVWERVKAERVTVAEYLLTFDLALSENLSLRESLALVAKQGYQRLLVNGEALRIDEAESRLNLTSCPGALTVIQDRLKLTESNRARFIEGCEQAYHFGRGKLAVHLVESPKSSSIDPASGSVRPVAGTVLFSSGFHCARCNLDYREPTPALFSFNHPSGACPACKGFGRIISIDYDLAIPDRSRTLAAGAVKPWQSGMSAECQHDLAKFCKVREVPMNVPFAKLSEEHQRWVLEGDPDYGSDEEHEWPRAWYGVKGYFRWLESKSYKMHVRVLLSRYRAYTTCPECHGQRLKPDALLYRSPVPDFRVASLGADRGAGDAGAASINHSISIADFYAWPIDSALAVIEQLASRHSLRPNDPLVLVLNEVRARLSYLVEVGLGYLTLDRPTRTLSGGETERVNLTACLGTRLVNTLFVLDEPSVGLHPRDTARLVRILEQLRDTGNTVVVVEHDASVMRAADQIVDLGPGQGEKGGEVVFCGRVHELLTDERSLTGQYLSGRKRMEVPTRRPVTNPPLSVSAGLGAERTARKGEGEMLLHEAPHPFASAPSSPLQGWLRVMNATRHNLKNVSSQIPLGRFVCLTGVSGSGKTTLVREVLLPALQAKLSVPTGISKASDRMEGDEGDGNNQLSMSHAPFSISGWESLSQVVLVDQSALGKTPRSNPVVYIGAFDHIRDLFAQTDLAKQRGLSSSAFSFNSGIGQCERCRGAGFEKIEMQFLSDVFIRCPECNGRRYREHILEVKLCGAKGKGVLSVQQSAPDEKAGRGKARSPSPGSPNTGHCSIADLLEATVDDALEFLFNFVHVPAGRRALVRLKLLQDVGLGYLRLGQPINTLSGGECQRLKLVSHLAESAAGETMSATAKGGNREGDRGAQTSHAPTVSPAHRRAENSVAPELSARRTLFLFDEPTTGLHFDDVRVLLQVFQRLVDAGHSLLVIEHNLDVIKSADWVIDLGPEAGERGGQLVAQGTPEDIAACEASHTGRFLREVLGA
jgi:excinuclease ABC subunit A